MTSRTNMFEHEYQNIKLQKIKIKSFKSIEKKMKQKITCGLETKKEMKKYNFIKKIFKNYQTKKSL